MHVLIRFPGDGGDWRVKCHHVLPYSRLELTMLFVYSMSAASVMRGGLGDISSRSSADPKAKVSLPITFWTGVGVLEPFWHGLPSFTSTGTATRLGDCCAHRFAVSGCWVALSFAWRFILYLWFWNQILTWVGVRWIMLAKCSLSGADRYFCCLKRRSSSYTCAWEKSTRRFLRGAACKVTIDLLASMPGNVPMFMPAEGPINLETWESKHINISINDNNKLYLCSTFQA